MGFLHHLFCLELVLAPWWHHFSFLKSYFVWLSDVMWIYCLTSQSRIFQSYMWRHIDVHTDWRSWTCGWAPKAIDISQGFFNVPVQAPTRDHLFYTIIPRNRPIKSPFTTRWGYWWHIPDINPQVLTGGLAKDCRWRFSTRKAFINS